MILTNQQHKENFYQFLENDKIAKEIENGRDCKTYWSRAYSICVFSFTLIFVIIVILVGFSSLEPPLAVEYAQTKQRCIILWSSNNDSQTDNTVVSCYYNTPDPTALDQLLPGNIHPFLCTHINVAFARIQNKQVYIDDHMKNSLPKILALKEKNPNLKIILSIGGAGNDSGFSEMVQNHASRKIFIRSIKYILRNYSLDGVDLDWEFPALNDQEALGSKRERQHFSQLLREIRMEYIREKREYILSVAAAAPETVVDVAYDVDQLNLYVDYVNIMTYDFHYYTKYTPFTGLNSPLFPRSTESLFLASLNINYTVHMYLSKGLDKSKMVIGIPTYGHSFTLVNPDNPTVGSPSSGYGATGHRGFVNYPEICSYLAMNKIDVEVEWDDSAKVPHLHRETEWISFDTPRSVMEKASYIKENKLRGAMIYSLNADDFRGICGEEVQGGGRFPLARSIKNALIFDSVVTDDIGSTSD